MDLIYFWKLYILKKDEILSSLIKKCFKKYQKIKCPLNNNYIVALLKKINNYLWKCFGYGFILRYFIFFGVK